MLHKLEIVNFQSHANTTIEFDENLTAITGLSNSGKTAILRAITWILRNRPSGTDFIREGQHEAVARLWLRDGSGVERRKSRDGKINSYATWTGDGVRQAFDVVGTQVPDAVTALLPLADINFQNQLQEHFLVLDSPGQVAQTIYQSCRMDHALGALDVLRSQQRQLNADNTRLAQERKRLKEAVADPSLIAAETASGLVVSADAIMVEDASLRSEHGRLVYCNDNYRNVRDRIKKLGPVVDAVSLDQDKAADIQAFVAESEASTSKLRRLQTQWQELVARKPLSRASLSVALDCADTGEALCQTTTNQSQTRAQLQELKRRHDTIRFQLRLQPAITEAEALARESSEIDDAIASDSEVADKLDHYAEKLQQLSSKISLASSDIKKMEAEMSRLFQQDPRCPVCGAELREDCL